MDVSLLDDEELVEQLKLHGLTPGPVVGSTRKFYEKKLTKLLNDIPSEGYRPPPDQEEEFSEADDDEDEDEVAIQPVIQPARSVPMRSSPDKKSSQMFQRTSEIAARRPYEDKPTQITQRATGLARPATASYRQQQQTPSTMPARSKPTPTAPTAKKQSKPWIPTWAKLLLIIIFILFVYLVIQNMEPAKDLPKIKEDSNV